MKASNTNTLTVRNAGKSENQQRKNHAFRIRWSTTTLGDNPQQGQYGSCVLLAVKMGGEVELGKARNGETVLRVKLHFPSYDSNMNLVSDNVYARARVGGRHHDSYGAKDPLFNALERAVFRVRPGASDGEFISDSFDYLLGSGTRALAVQWATEIPEYLQELDDALDAGRTVVFVGDSDTPSGKNGIHDLHAYRATGDVIDDATGQLVQGMVNLRNPWGFHHLLGTDLADLISRGENYGSFYIAEK